MDNASLDPAYDETGGTGGWPTGSKGLVNSNRGAYLTAAGVPMNFRSIAGDDILLSNVPGTSTQGAGRLYMTYVRMS